MSETNEVFLLIRALENITIEYYWAPFNIKPVIKKEILFYRKAINLLLKDA